MSDVSHAHVASIELLLLYEPFNLKLHATQILLFDVLLLLIIDKQVVFVWTYVELWSCLVVWMTRASFTNQGFLLVTDTRVVVQSDIERERLTQFLLLLQSLCILVTLLMLLLCALVLYQIHLLLLQDLVMDLDGTCWQTCLLGYAS
jgi:hypothetical protein